MAVRTTGVVDDKRHRPSGRSPPRGVDGQPEAIHNNTEGPELKLADLHGDIIASAYLSETATELASKTDTSEFGVPTTSLPAKYSWLGAIEFPTEALRSVQPSGG